MILPRFYSSWITGLTVCRFLPDAKAPERAKELDERYYARELPHKFKFGVTGCQNNCLKAEENDLGIKGGIKVSWRESDCIGCGVCIKACRSKALSMEGGRITLESARKGDLAEITVRDNGSGVAPEDREKIFDRFFTADRAHTAGKGTGLGLSICRRILEMHGQSIRLLDTEEGAAFRFTLQAAEKKPSAS